MHYEYSFFNNPKVRFQGTEEQLKIFKKNHPNLKRISGTNGSYILREPCSGHIIEFIDEYSTNPTRTIIPSEHFILRRSGKSEIREVDFRNIVTDLNSGCLKIEDVI